MKHCTAEDAALTRFVRQLVEFCGHLAHCVVRSETATCWVQRIWRVEWADNIAERTAYSSIERSDRSAFDTVANSAWTATCALAWGARTIAKLISGLLAGPRPSRNEMLSSRHYGLDPVTLKTRLFMKTGNKGPEWEPITGWRALGGGARLASPVTRSRPARLREDTIAR